MLRGADLCSLQGKEPACTLRGAALHACSMGSWLAHTEEPHSTVSWQGASLNAQGSWFAHSRGQGDTLHTQGSQLACL